MAAQQDQSAEPMTQAQAFIMTAANNYAKVLVTQARFAEAKALLRKAVPVARRVVGESHEVTLKIRWIYAMALYMDTGATPDDLREAVTTLEDLVPIARRVFGGTHPITVSIETCLRDRDQSAAALSPCRRRGGGSRS